VVLQAGAVLPVMQALLQVVPPDLVEQAVRMMPVQAPVMLPEAVAEPVVVQDLERVQAVVQRVVMQEHAVVLEPAVRQALQVAVPEQELRLLRVRRETCWAA